MQRFMSTLAPLLARLLLAGIFAWSGYAKLFGATGRAIATISGRGIPSATLAAYVAGGVELIVAGLVVLGLRARLAAVVAVLYLVVVTWLFHWRPALRGDVGQTIHLLKNAGLAGGMLLLASFGPGPASIDRG